MSFQNEIKIVFSGAVGAGKTTAIGCISGCPPVTTEALTTDDGPQHKPTTTAALDYGELDLGDDMILRLYGTPGQLRFRHMWELLLPGSLGTVVLVDNSRSSPLEDVAIYLDNFHGLVDPNTLIIGLTKTDISAEPGLEAYEQFLSGRGESFPVMAVDVRSRDDVLRLLDTLLHRIEATLQ